MEIKFDIITLLYNSEKWLKGYLDALEKSEYNLSFINLVLVDNQPSIDYKPILETHSLIGKLGSYRFIANEHNNGFGAGNNQGVKFGDSPYLFLLNIDTEITPQALKEISLTITQSQDNVGAWEMRQFPYEHPKVYHPANQFVSWASAAALVVRRTVFEQIGGFDDRLFMYAEDVDLSWNIRRAGFKIQYCPKSVVYHYSYSEENEVKPLQFYYSIYNNLLLRFKYGTWSDIKNGYLQIQGVKNSTNPVFADQKTELKKLMANSFKIGRAFRKNRPQDTIGFRPSFLGFDYEVIRSGAFFENTPWWKFPSLPKVSVVVRTHKRPLVLEEAIKSLLNQTYPNIEIVIVEDGQNTAQAIYEKYSGLGNIQYHYTGINRGRSHAGNMGMSNATGAYLCFLDDDDLVYADHIETIVGELLKGDFDLVHAPAFCVSTNVKSNDPYVYEELDFDIRHDYPIEKEELLNNNLFPIQSVIFKKQLFDELGGFDESIDYLEDWALWLKYVKDASISYVDKVTSLYRVPSSSKLFKTRLSQLLSTRNYVLSKYAHNYLVEKNTLELDVDKMRDLLPFDAKRFKIHVDSLIFGFNCLSINGWAVIDKKTNFDKIYLKIDINNQLYYFKVSFDKRRDIQRKFETNNKTLGFKGDLQILGINGNIVPFSLIFIKDGMFVERDISWKSFYKIILMARLRRFVHYFW